ncbi:uncharacterized protein A4U43_C01F21300 [Asparagus officinalis]|uniref:Uncharacterized protein n=1 Tax=Asparagus officinalis TaxID=4686 RepID=A0A5P1FVG7_ASPOF|nr:uncharacterized protein A4U43_C01F21300 [Asparagus officinalis]
MTGEVAASLEGEGAHDEEGACLRRYGKENGGEEALTVNEGGVWWLGGRLSAAASVMEESAEAGLRLRDSGEGAGKRLALLALLLA